MISLAMLNKNSHCLHFFEDLPSEVVGEVFSRWLDLKSLTFIDSALCNHHARPLLLELFASDHCTRGRNELLRFGKNSTCVKWLTLRKMQSVLVFLDASSHEISEYLRLFSNSIRSMGCRDKDAINLVAENCRSLTHLTCIWTEVEQSLVSALGSNPNLEKLHLENVKGLSAMSFQGLKLPQLTLLSLSGSTCNDAVVTALVCATEKLQYIQVGFGCRGITDAGLLVIAQHCPTLRSVGLSYLRISDHALEQLTKLCPLIEHLDLEENSVVTDAGVISLSKNLRQLRNINLSYCTNVTDVALEYLEQYHASTLQSIRIILYHPVRVDVLVRLLQRCQTLHEIQIGCDLNAYYAEVVPHMSHLRNLYTLSSLSDECLCMIAQHCTQLQRLSIPCTMAVDQDAVRQDNRRVMLHADVLAEEDDIMYSEKGLFALMHGLPNLLLLLGSMITWDILDYRTAASKKMQATWQRMRPKLKFKECDACLNFNVLKF